MSLGALILAKGISRRCENKNTRMCGDKRLIEWAIDNAHGAKCIEQVFVSTDSELIKDIAYDRGAIIIDRPKQLTDEFTSGSANKLYALKSIHDMGLHYDHMVDVWCTSPLVQSWQIQDAYDQFSHSNWATQLHTVTKAKFSTLGNAKILDPALKRIYSPFGLAQAPAYFTIMDWVYQNGAFQITNPNIIDYDTLPEITPDMTPQQLEFSCAPFLGAWGSENFAKMHEDTYGYVIDGISAFDINTEEELDLADYYFRKRKENNINAGI